MPFYKVKVGKLANHNGDILSEGAVIELPLIVGENVTEQFEPCTKEGQSLAALSPEDRRVAQARLHERVSIRQMQVDDARAALALAESALDEEKRLEAKAAPADVKAAPDVKVKAVAEEVAVDEVQPPASSPGKSK